MTSTITVRPIKARCLACREGYANVKEAQRCLESHPIPTPTRGLCTKCFRYNEELGEGLCVKCWDKGVDGQLWPEKLKNKMRHNEAAKALKQLQRMA